MLTVETLRKKLDAAGLPGLEAGVTDSGDYIAATGEGYGPVLLARPNGEVITGRSPKHTVDSAVAEVAENIRAYHKWASAALGLPGAAETRALQAERDTLQAEVERLRAENARLRAGQG